MLYDHLRMGRTERPLIKGKSPEELKAFIEQQIALREPFYSQAKHTLDVSLMENYEKIKISVERLRELLGI